MKTLVALGALAVLTLTAAACTRTLPTAAPAYTLVWSDEFDGAPGALPDGATWHFDVGTDWGNQQLEYDTARAQNVMLDGTGNLQIVARKEAYLGRQYTSGRITTRGSFAQNEGRIEARIQLPSGQGLWPAFWMLGSDIGTVNWPACGEIDIMEYRGQLPTVVTGSLHGPGYSGGNALTGSFTAHTGRFDDGFHVYAIEWSAGRITWLVDGQAYQQFTRDDVPPSSRWVFDHPFFVILNVAVGGNYVGSPNASTTFPQTMTVDYVRAYALRDAQATSQSE